MNLVKHLLSLMALIALIASVVTLSPSPTHAQGIGTGYAAIIRIQNLGTQVANCTLTAYKEDGTASASQTVTIEYYAAGSTAAADSQ